MKEQSLEEYRKKKKEAKARMTAMQNLGWEDITDSDDIPGQMSIEGFPEVMP